MTATNYPVSSGEHGFIPLANVMNITNGYNAEKDGTLCSK